MKKRPMRIELYFTMAFLFMLVFAAAAFLSGVQVGANRMEEKYDYLKMSPSAPDFSDSYQQQDMVNFYHNVFLPYREFKSGWTSKLNDLSLQTSGNVSGTLKEMAIFSDSQYDQVQHEAVFSSSPLLQESQTNTLKSLKLFQNAALNAESISPQKGVSTLSTLQKDPTYIDAVKYGLLAQKQYYAAMLKWGSKVNTSMPAQYKSSTSLTLKEWNAYPLLLKNEAISAIMLDRSIYDSYDPQDVTAKVDAWITSGKANSAKLNSVQAIVKVLHEKEAVQSHDFIKLKNQYYSQELLPQIPFFYEKIY